MVEGNNDLQVLIPFHLMVEPRGGLETQNVREVQKQATYSCAVSRIQIEKCTSQSRQL